MERYPDWPVRLNQYILAVHDREFKYGEHDCCLFLAGEVIAITGEDPMAEYRGHYDSLESGERLVREIGAGTVLKTLYKKFGRPLPGAMGRKGDIAWYKDDDHPDGAVGLVLGRQAMFIGENGYVLIRLSRIKYIFRVG